MKDFQIESAKEVPISDILDKLNIPYKSVGGQIKIPCLFHEEYNGSLTIYEDNHFYCFGCNESGDNIKLIRRILPELTFTESVELINLIGEGN